MLGLDRFLADGLVLNAVNIVIVVIRLLFMDLQAATVIEVFPAEESELATLGVALDDDNGVLRGPGAHAWPGDGTEAEEEGHEKEKPAAAEGDFGAHAEQRLDSSQHGAQEEEELQQQLQIRPKSGWVGFIDFGERTDDDDRGEGESPKWPMGTKPKKRKKKKKEEEEEEKVKSESGRGRGELQRRRRLMPPHGVPAISLTEPTPPTSLSEDEDDENGVPRERRGRQRGSGVEALDKHHRWSARKRRKQSGDSVVGSGSGASEVRRKKRTKAAADSRNATLRNGAAIGTKKSTRPTSMSVSTASLLDSIDGEAGHSGGTCPSGTKRGRTFCKGTVLVSLGMAIAGALYFGSVSVKGSSAAAAALLTDAFNCSATTDCERHQREELDESRWADGTTRISAAAACALDHCLAPCSAAPAVKRCGGGLCVTRRDCKNVFAAEEGDADAAEEERRVARRVLLGILAFALCCLAVAVAVMTPCVKRPC